MYLEIEDRERRHRVLRRRLQYRINHRVVILERRIHLYSMRMWRRMWIKLQRSSLR